MRRLFHFESRQQPVASPALFRRRLTRNGVYAIGFIVLSLVVGTCGYIYFENMLVIDAVANASMILGGMGPLTPLMTNGGKIFASIYAIFSGLMLIGVSTLMLAPVFHRILHRFHVDEHDSDAPKPRRKR